MTKMPFPSKAEEKSSTLLPHNLLVDELFELLLAQIIFVFIKVEELLGDRGSSRLIIGVMVRLKVWVLEGLLHCDTLDGVKGEELFEEVQGEIGCLREQRPERNLLLEWQRTNIFPGTAGLDAVVVFHCRGSQNVENQGQLMVV